MTDHDSTRLHPIRDPRPREGVEGWRGRARLDRSIDRSFVVVVVVVVTTSLTRDMFTVHAKIVQVRGGPDRSNARRDALSYVPPSRTDGGHLEIRPARSIDRRRGGANDDEARGDDVTVDDGERERENERERTVLSSTLSSRRRAS